MSDYVIQTDRLTKRYGNILAVDELSIQVRRGHVYGLLGPNGSGKTTTMGMLLGLLKPTSGAFTLFGESDNLEASLRRIGAVIETPPSIPISPVEKTWPTSRESPSAAPPTKLTASSTRWAWPTAPTPSSTRTLWA